MSSSRPSNSSSNPGRSRHSSRIIAQTTVDAKIHADFEESGGSFDYSNSVRVGSSVGGDQQPRSDKVTTAYLHNIQKGKTIQPFGCLLALDEKTFKVIAYSANAPEMLTTVSHAVPSVGESPVLGIGTDIRTIFTAPSASALHKALGFGEVSLLNPILVHCKTSGKPFYAITHRVTGSLIIDFEPVKPYEVPMTAAGALQSYKLAAKAIARLQSLPSGSMERLCDTMVQEVFELTGYDRVMTYKFHDDDHGEVVSELTKPGLEPYLGLHYPSTDIPQAARFLFMKNKVRMIVNCGAKLVKVFQDEKLPLDLTLCGSTLRAPHSCHLEYMKNMNSIASLVMAVVVNEGDDEVRDRDSVPPQKRKRLWGLVVCHNTSPRFVAFPLRYACEFLTQVFAIHVNKEIEMEDQMVEKNILRTQTLLCDMLLRDAPLGIMSQSPNVMDLVKCDGAALLYKNKVWRLGMTPNDFQLHDIASWLSEDHMDSTGLSTDSLYDAGFPGALALGDVVCGMAAVWITSKDVLFWLRSHTAAEIRWGGAKHETGEKDDGSKMHPRSSFKAFLEVVKTRSLPWKDYEMDAIHSLQLILRNAFKDVETTLEANTKAINVRLSDLKLEGMEELEAVTSEMVRLIETATVPILAVGVDGLVNGWNTKIDELTGLPVDEAIGKHLLTLVEDSSTSVVKKMLDSALRGKEEQNIQFEIKTHGSRADLGPISLVVNACASRDIRENVVGVCFVAQDITGQKNVMDKFTRIEGDYKAIVQNPSPLIPPIFGTDEFGWCSEWNSAMTKLTGWKREEVMDKMLLGEVFGINMACCPLKSQESFVNLGVVLNHAMTGQVSEKLPFGFCARSGKHIECLLCVSKKLNSEGSVTGVFCFLQLASPELQQALNVQRLSEQTAVKRLKELSYIRRQIRNPLAGIIFSRKMMEDTELGAEQQRLLHTSAQCQHQLNKILDDSDLDTIIDGYLDLEMVEFTLHEVLNAAVSQVMIKSNAKSVRIVHNAAEDIMTETLYGDSLRLQQVIADFLAVSVSFMPTGGQLTIEANLTKDRLGRSVQLVHLELRITHAGGGIPEGLLNQMFGNNGDISEEGISLLISSKLVKLMNGDVRYLREEGRSTFMISVELAAAHKITLEQCVKKNNIKRNAANQATSPGAKSTPWIQMMDIKAVSFAAENPPLAELLAAKLAGISLPTDASLPPDSLYSLQFSNGLKLHGKNVLLRYIGRIAKLYGDNPFEAGKIDEWLEYAPVLSQGSAFESACKHLDDYLGSSTFFANQSLSIADIAIWSGLAGTGKRWESLRNSKKYPNLSRWFNSLLAEYGDALNEVTATFIGKKGSGKPTATKTKGTQADQQLKSVNGDVSEKGKAGSKPTSEVDLPEAEVGKVRLRFAPEPSGYLHIGHSKAALLNQYFAQRYKGQLIVRFDDTNPDKESNEFVDNLLKDIETLGIKYETVTYTSDYFPQLMEMAENLIRQGKAYVDDTPREEMKKERMDGIESKCRNNSVEENLKLWNEMIAGSKRGKECCVRGKLDMQDPNKSLRDPVYYRCNPTPHHRIGSKYNLYPTYDFACPFVDSIEGITHALRSSEYHDRNAQYYRVQEDMGLRKVHIYEFSRLNMVYTLLSKRKLLWFVQNEKVSGWDDPRFPTVQGIVRRGLKVEALIQFILEQGASKNLNLMEWDKLWTINKKIIDPVCPRHTAVIEERPVLLTLTNGPEKPFVRIIPRHKKYEGAGEKATTYTRRIWLDHADAESIKVDEEVTLMDWGNAIVKGIEKDTDGNLKLTGVLHPEGSVKTTKLKLTWLPESDELVKLSLMEFDHLITKKKLEEDEDFVDVVNPCTEKETAALGDSNMRNLKCGDILQLERKGYFRCDVPYLRPSKPVVLFAIPDGRQQTGSK